MSFTTVQFMPCGHTDVLDPETVLKYARRQVEDIEAGRKLDAPILPSSECPDCQEWYARQDLAELA